MPHVLTTSKRQRARSWLKSRDWLKKLLLQTATDRLVDSITRKDKQAADGPELVATSAPHCQAESEVDPDIHELVQVRDQNLSTLIETSDPPSAQENSTAAQDSVPAPVPAHDKPSQLKVTTNSTWSSLAIETSPSPDTPPRERFPTDQRGAFSPQTPSPFTHPGWEEGHPHATLSYESDSTLSAERSEVESVYAIETPLTSPCTSPVKSRSLKQQFDGTGLAHAALDGGDDLDNAPTRSASARKLASCQRHPSSFLRYCERSTTSRQRRSMAGALGSPDRFVPSRSETPTKEGLLLQDVCTKRSDDQRKSKPIRGTIDPFGPSATSNGRTAERFPTLRRLPRSSDLSRIPGSDIVVPARRAVSAGAMWTVGGTVVTEGVASVSDGRGGRVTSSTSAPHYTADFLWRVSSSEEEVRHGQRLAVAMDVTPSSRMLTYSPPSSPTSDASRRSPGGELSPQRTYWNNSAWEKDIMTSPTKKSKRKPKEVPVIPFRVLDAPALRDDYYCSLLSYSHTMHCLAVGLGPHVYLWSEARRTTPTHTPDSLTAPFAAHVTSVSFSSGEGGSAILAIGRADGRITLWSPQDQNPRFDSEQPAPVSCVCFRPCTVRRPSVRDPAITVTVEELLVGDEVGNVYYYSVEWPSPAERDIFDWHGSMTLLARMSCHNQQVCGIAWSSDGSYFATGGNDNQLYLFEPKKVLAANRGMNAKSTVNVRNGNTDEEETVAGQGQVISVSTGGQKHVFGLNAAVKAISFAPWQSTLLAAGGGSNDRCIHFFHALSGARLATIDCHAQVTSLVWSEKRRELAATFGFAQPEHPYRLAVFSWPSCRTVVGIPWWGEERALYAVAYPGGPSGNQSQDRRTREEGCLVVATSDASIKFHEIWPERSETASPSDRLLGGSLILEDAVSPALERSATIR